MDLEGTQLRLNTYTRVDAGARHAMRATLALACPEGPALLQQEVRARIVCVCVCARVCVYVGLGVGVGVGACVCVCVCV